MTSYFNNTKNMKASSFMIGDIVNVYPSNLPIHIAAVHNRKVAYHSVEHRLEWVRESLLRPIPITPEILEKNGFELNEGSSIENFLSFTIDKIGTDENYEVVVDWRDSFDNGATDAFNHVHWEECWQLHIMCKWKTFKSEGDTIIYVHQLQHAIRLCGIEKEIII